MCIDGLRNIPAGRYKMAEFLNFRHSQVHGEMSELVEGARLEIVCAAKSGTEGSNPSLSAKKALPQRDLK